VNSRERVLTALNFQRPDRVPIDLGGQRCSGVMAMAYARLRDYLGLPQRPLRIQDMVLQLALVDEDVLDRFGVDTLDVDQGFALSDSDWKPWVLPNGLECLIPRRIELERDGDTWYLLAADGTRIGVQKPSMVYFEETGAPLKEALRTGDFSGVDRLEDVMAHCVWSAIPGPTGIVPMNDEGRRFLAAGARQLRERTDRCIISSVRAGPLLEGGQHVFGMEDFSVLLAAEPKLAHHFLDNLVDFYLKRIEFTLSAIGPYIDVVICFDDFGTQTGLMISPKMYHEFFKPRQKILWQRVRELADVKILLHSCGNMAQIVPDLVEVGLDAWNPVQISARNMEPERLQADLGGKITFWGGGCDTQQVLRTGTPEEIRAHVRHNLDVFCGAGAAGGYVFTQVHNIMADVAPERITAMFDAAAEWSRERVQ
jgi:uroporphyrinogen decarboxylase